MIDLKLHPKNYQNIAKKTATLIKKGKVMVCPTDTVYGLICDATNKKAVAKIFRIKKRPKNKPLPIFVKDLKMAKQIAEINKRQEKFLKSVWPGKVTVVLKSKIRWTQSGLPVGLHPKSKIYGVDKKTVALRIPSSPAVLNLVKHINVPLTGTSANISGKPPSGNIKEILRQFRGKKHQPDIIIDAGNLPKSKPSTVLDLTKLPYKILRL